MQKKSLSLLVACVPCVLYMIYWLVKAGISDAYLGIAISSGILLLISIFWEFHARKDRLEGYKLAVSQLLYMFQELEEIHSILDRVDEKDKDNAFQILQRSFKKGRPSPKFENNLDTATIALRVMQNSLEEGNTRKPRKVLKSLFRKIDDPIVIGYLKDYLELPFKV